MSEKPSIVSLLPSSTEIACALGFKDNIVGRSHECDYPGGLSSLPVLTAPKFNEFGTSIEINDQVRDILKFGMSVYKLDVSLLESLKPDYIITQSQCEVCAVSMSDVEAAVCELISSNPQIVNLEPNSLDDVYGDFMTVAKALGVPERGEELVKKIKQRLHEISALTSKLENKPRVLTIEWLSPIMTAGNWVPEMIDIAGGENLLSSAGEHSHYHEWEEVKALDPDIIVIMPCGFDIDRTMKEIELLTALKGWSDLRAVKGGDVFVTDGNQYFNRPGPRIMESVEILAEIFHPESFQNKHLGTGYIRLA
ncbi:MAG: cobalamin-binding protein [Bacteroidota bacterium]